LSTIAHYLTAELPGIGGVFKATPDDFLVEELPLYAACGEGEHLYLTIEKRGITTLEALRRLAKALGAAERDCGYAGLKDSVGVTRQTVSLPRVSAERAATLEVPGIRVLTVARHRNKLKPGHLAGNRFQIRLRAVVADAPSRAEAILAVLARRGVPNFFGEQRYGAQGNSHLIGRAVLEGDFRQAVLTLMGTPAQVSDPAWREALGLFQAGDFPGCLARLPGFCRSEREVVARLVAQPDNWAGAFKAVHPRLVSLYLSACQSALFDQVVASRLAATTLDVLLPGDLAFRHGNGACFLVTDPAAEATRLAALEISPSGPMFGTDLLQPQGEPLAMEEGVLAAAGLTLASFAGSGRQRLSGERRPLRVPLADPVVTPVDADLTVSFKLPRGAYATVVLNELMKTGQEQQTG
jgi:tRNA pseudouridine13 synthase